MKVKSLLLMGCWVSLSLHAGVIFPLYSLSFQQGDQGVQKKKSFLQKVNPFREMGEEITMTLYPPAEFPLAGKVLLITYKNESGDKNNDTSARKLAAMVQSAVQDGLLDVRVSLHEEKGKIAAMLRGSYDGLHKKMLKIGEFQTAEYLLRVKLLESSPFDAGWGSQEIKVRAHRATAVIEIIDLQQGVSLKTKTVTAEERQEGFNNQGLASRARTSAITSLADRTGRLFNARPIEAQIMLPKTKHKRLKHIKFLITSNRFVDAVREARQLVDAHDSSLKKKQAWQVQHLLGVACMLAGNYEGAERALLDALALHPNNKTGEMLRLKQRLVGADEAMRALSAGSGGE